MRKFLVIQPAFTGDVVLATALVEKLRISFPDATIDFLVRKGNEGLLDGHPYISKLWVWDKKAAKIKNLLRLCRQLRAVRYTHTINVHRFFTGGLLAVSTGAGYISGFDKNPLSALFTRKVAHVIGGKGQRVFPTETMRNQLLIADITDNSPALPVLYPADSDLAVVAAYQHVSYVCVAPSSVWFTKRFPAEQWVTMINRLPPEINVYLIGAPSDGSLCESIRAATERAGVWNLCGQLTFLQSAALMKGAIMNYTNDSAPLHIASATKAPVTAVFCSTIPEFGFGPLGENARVVETQESLDCRPCGLHGHQACPKGHFKCARQITNEQLLWWTSKTT